MIRGERETDGCRPPVKGDEAITFEEAKKEERDTETTKWGGVQDDKFKYILII